jgi:urease accessory protein
MQCRSTHFRLFLTLALFFTPWLAQANPGHYESSFSHGLLHPLMGLDHICAMIAVGLWAAQRGGKAVWLLPVAFVVMMFAGGLLGKAGLALPQVEAGLLVSVLILGLLVAAAVRLPVWLSAMVAGVFAIFHGHAHAVETPMNVSALTYDVGFLLATAGLHLVGIAFGLAVARLGKISLVRYAGGAIVCCGVVLLAR